jgi:hypothetical protein
LVRQALPPGHDEAASRRVHKQDRPFDDTQDKPFDGAWFDRLTTGRVNAGIELGDGIVGAG